MSDKRKLVKYKDNEYLISYNYTTERKIDGLTNHVINILKVNNRDISPIYNYSWADKINQPESIIGRVRTAIEFYLENTRNKFSYLNEFNWWDGNLDEWDE